VNTSESTPCQVFLAQQFCHVFSRRRVKIQML